MPLNVDRGDSRMLTALWVIGLLAGCIGWALFMSTVSMESRLVLQRVQGLLSG